MLFVSSLLDRSMQILIKRTKIREALLKKALDKKLRHSKFGHVVIRNLNKAMNQNNSYHDELAKLMGTSDYEAHFWESDLGFLWHLGNQDTQSDYNKLALDLIHEHKLTSHLDIGCGWGAFAAQTSKVETMENVLGTDVISNVIEEARKRHGTTNAVFACKDVRRVHDQYDMVTMFNCSDYMLTKDFEKILIHCLNITKKFLIITNSLRKVPYLDALEFTKAKTIKRYDVGHVQPLNDLLGKLSTKFSFDYEMIKCSTDMQMAVVRIKQ